MKSLLASVLLALTLHAAALAQGVYVTPGEHGPVFSDKPQPGAREVILPPLNVVAPPQDNRATVSGSPAEQRGDGASAEVAAFGYRAFSIVQPENEGSVVANTAIFEVRVALDPPLQLDQGHAFVVSIDGRPVGQRFTATEFMIPPDFWGGVVPPAVQRLQLDASIIDRDGRELKKAEPVRFYMRHATRLNRHRPPLPPPHPVAPVAPVPGKAVGAAIK